MGVVPVLAQLLAPFAGRRALECAERLIERFGSIRQVMAASARQIASVEGIGNELADMLTGARALVEIGMREQVRGAPVDISDPSFLDYLRARFVACDRECLFVFYLDRDGAYITDECLGTGEASRVASKIRTLFHRAIELASPAIILAHNHPSGSCRPSAQDIAETRKLSALAAALGIEIRDHIIVAGASCCSMRRAGLLDNESAR